MRTRLGSVLLVLVTAVGTLAVSALLSLIGAPKVVQSQAARPDAQVPRLPGTKTPNITGVWQALNEANWELEPHGQRTARVLHAGVKGGQPVPDAPVLALGATGGIPGSNGVVEGGVIPYKPDTLARRNANAEHALARDPEVKCLLPGVPRATYLPYPFQITQGDKKVMIAYGFSNAGRTIHLDTVEDPGLESWMGHSVGRWEGDTLVVTVTNLNEKTWFDRAGNFHSADMKVVERYTPTSPDHILYEATIEDPAVFTRPWKIKMPLYRRVDEHARVFEYRCVEMVEELIYGHLRKQQLVKSWEDDYGRLGGVVGVTVVRKPTREEEQ